jgi:hypothetical protein
VKIRNKAHCSSIVDFLEQHIQTHGLPTTSCQLRLAVEGNIGAGEQHTHWQRLQCTGSQHACMDVPMCMLWRDVKPPCQATMVPHTLRSELWSLLLRLLSTSSTTQPVFSL